MAAATRAAAAPAYLLDTNVFIYALSRAPDHAAKAAAARSWLARADWGVSTQVLMELYANLRQPRHGLAPTAAQDIVEAIAADRPVQAVDRQLVLDALGLRHRAMLSHWDAAILCAAQRLGAHTVVSEDLEHGRDYGGVKVLNPFAMPASTAAETT
jgi:predicted nucleic acid-binding protein